MSPRARHARRSGGARSGRPAAAGGFTLLELALVIVLLGVLAGMAVPSLSWLGAAQRNVAAARVRTTLVFAQEWALSTSDATWVAFDVVNEVVTVYVEDPANPGKANRLTMQDPLTRAALVLQLGTSVGVGLDAVDFGGTPEVQFDELGAPHDSTGAPLATDGAVTLTGGEIVRVTRGTGLVSVD